VKRRRFLQVAGVAGAGVAAGCGTEAADHLYPYLIPEEDLVPGIPTWYASTCRECPAGCGILVKAREGRAIKIEGNPLHPVNRGRLCARGQAALQGLYDPDRFAGPMRKSGTRWESVSWEAAIEELAGALGAGAASGRGRIALLTGSDSGVLDRFGDEFLAAFGSDRRLRYEAFAHEPLREANRLTFGVDGMAQYDFRAARYLLSFGADFLETWISPTEFASSFADAHAYHERHMARLVCVEPRRGMTGFSADEWVAPRPGTEAQLALGVAAAIVRLGRARVTGVDADRLRAFLVRFDGRSVAEATGVSEETIDRLAREFTDESPSLAVAGGVANQHRAATQLAAAVNLLNVAAGNLGRTVRFPASSAWDRVARYREVRALIAAMDAGEIDVVLVHGTNPAYSLPPSAGFSEAFRKVALRVSFASHPDETSELCDLVLPDHTPLEAWGAPEPVAGVVSLQQPAMRPVRDTRQTAEVLLAVAQRAGRVVGGGAASARDLVRGRRTEAQLEASLMRGGEFSATPARPVRLVTDFMRLDWQPATFDGDAGGPVLVEAPSVALYDGRGANKAWLQELPDPTTKITWQTWVELHPETAAALGVRSGDIVRVAAGDRSVEAPIYTYPGVRRDVVAMPLGRGHTSYGRNARGHGVNPVALLSADVTDPSGALVYCQTRVTITPTGGRRPLATTEGSPRKLDVGMARQYGRGIARWVTLHDLMEGHIPHEEHEPLTEAERRAIARAESSQADRANLAIYREPHPKWEMVIDLSRCTGCSACVVACEAENNIPMVGEEQVVRSREMAWIRLERYFEGDTGGTDWHVAQIPMLCQHCERAPCEPVCPVYAAYRTPDGLNGQIYNRCVGTRYCANNCPYKVRYFNWWDHGDPGSDRYSFPGTLAWQLNPDVTVRTKGVMEKCTFCVQRIRFAQNDAKVRGTTLRDGDVVPACAQTCPSNAIVFGDAKDPGSRVSRAKQDERGYHVFTMLNTRPAITYLRRVIDAPES
jgi:molybdopterin-containing oxidoreductase family iron-sulfur binding subunit